MIFPSNLNPSSDPVLLLAGLTWTARTAATSQTLRSVVFATASSVYIVGAAGVILHSNDSGLEWTSMSRCKNNACIIDFLCYILLCGWLHLAAEFSSKRLNQCVCLQRSEYSFTFRSLSQLEHGLRRWLIWCNHRNGHCRLTVDSSDEPDHIGSACCCLYKRINWDGSGQQWHGALNIIWRHSQSNRCIHCCTFLFSYTKSDTLVHWHREHGQWTRQDLCPSMHQYRQELRRFCSQAVGRGIPVRDW